MSFQQEKLLKIDRYLDQIFEKAKQLEALYENELLQVHSVYRKSAINLIHYLALRTFKIDKVEQELRNMGLPGLSSVEPHVMWSLLNLKKLLNILLESEDMLDYSNAISYKKSKKILRKNTKLLFGYKSRKRSTRIMVTLPTTAAEEPELVKKLIANGMNCARINCAHDDPAIWSAMIKNVKEAGNQLNKKCLITMDLGGPKLRTGMMTPGPKVVHIRPERDDLGRVINPSRIWIAPPDVPVPGDVQADAFLPVDPLLLMKMKRGNTIYFVDSRGKKCKISIGNKEGAGRWGICFDSAYVETGTEIVLHKEKQTGEEVHRIGEILPKQQFIMLHQDDQLRLHRDPSPGESALYNENGELTSMAHISCTLPQIFKDVKVGEPIYFDDGKVEASIQTVSDEELLVLVKHAKDKGSKLKADKGINLPESNLRIRGLTEKDKQDLSFVADRADAINFSFVNRKEDVLDLYEVLDQYQSTAGVILKIETQQGFSNLPSILLTAMRSHPVGVMIARGDLAIETGWKNFATIQQEIMRICSAAHIPNVWATQVLENLAKKGTPSRAEITDAALAEQAECVMLNKGYYINRAVKMLDKILRRMQRFQRKNQIMLPKLEHADELKLSHKPFDV